MFGSLQNKKINVYCGWHRSTIIKQRPIIKNDFIFQIKCFECNGSGIFDCGIQEENGTCVSCNGTGKQYIGTI
ncbi:MAG: hypothetical protein ACLVCH_11555 [Roseburia inulinivorans]